MPGKAPRVLATNRTVIRLYRSLLRETCYFFDDHARNWLWSRIRHKFSKYKNETDPAFIEHLCRKGKADLRRLRRANAGETDNIMLVLRMAWGKCGEIMDAKINNVIRHWQTDKFPINPTKLPVSIAPVMNDEDRLDKICRVYPGLYPSLDSGDVFLEDSVYHEILSTENDISRNLFKEGAEKILRETIADSGYIDFDHSKAVLHKAVTYPPYSELPIRRIRYSGPFRALVLFNGLHPNPQFPTPRLQYAAMPPGLSVRRINNIEKRHFQRLLKKVKKNMPVDEYLAKSVLRKITPLDRLLTSSEGEYKGMRFTYPDLQKFQKHLRYRTKDKQEPQYSVKRRQYRRLASPRPRYIRRRYESLVKTSPVLHTDNDGNWKAATFRLPKREPPPIEEWML
ncbi:hypothetical protein V1525DRAFT_444930 [Lipomyces kononenkoae]|uniref:Uncharacterized protein n=1 Tax=Lipomyces kononenkoae TaxID=34357 RepID=A0ACC3T9P6_LIPKO